MIVLMLDRAREKSASLDLKHLAFQRLCAHQHGLRSLNVACDFRKTQTTLDAQFGFAAQLDFWIDQDDRHRAPWIDIFATELERAWPVFDSRNVQHGHL